MTTLLGFAFNTAQERVNLPQLDGKTNANFLPTLLLEIDDPEHAGQKLLPLSVKGWDVGTISGNQGRTISEPIATWYGNYLMSEKGLDPSTTVAIANPDHPDPSLSLSNVKVVALENAFLMPNPLIQSSESGYLMTFSLAANGFDDLPRLRLRGEFLLTQDVCMRDPDAPYDVDRCGGYSTSIDGTGKFSVAVNDALIDIQLFLSTTSADPHRGLRLEIRSLAVRGSNRANPEFAVTIESIDKAPKGLEKIWVKLAQDAFSSPEAKASVLNNFASMLNAPDTRQGLAQKARQQVSSTLDKILGPVPAAGLPDDSHQIERNPLDLYLIDRLRVALSDPTSGWYLPLMLAKNKSPTLEPYAADVVDLGALTISGLPWDANTLNHVVVTALSNNLAPPDQILCNGNVVQVTSNQGTISSPPPGVAAGPLKLAGSFSVRPQGLQPITGTFQTVIENSRLDIVGSASGDRVETLEITLSQLALKLDNEHMVTTLQVTSDSGLASLAASMVNSAKVKTLIRDQLTQKLAAPDTLASLSGTVTKLARAAIVAQLVNQEQT
jgi:hypothetical protein